MPTIETPTPPADLISEDAILKGAPEDAEPATAALPPVESTSDITAKAMLTIAESVKALVESQQSVRQIPLSEIKPVSPWNPEGKRNRVPLSRVTMINGNPLNPMMMTEGEIILANELKPGRYMNRKIEVQRSQDGTINIVWANAKIEQRMEMAALYPDFTALAKAVINDRKAKEEKRKSGVVEEQEWVG